MKPAWALQTNAQRSPNSAGSPKRPEGFARWRSRTTSSMVRPLVFAWMAIVERRRSVSNGPGRRLLIVTLWPTVLRASPATKPVSPVRAPFESPRMSMGCFLAGERQGARLAESLRRRAHDRAAPPDSHVHGALLLRPRARTRRAPA